VSTPRPVRARPAGRPGRTLAALAALALALALWGCGPKALREDAPPAAALWAAFDGARTRADGLTRGFSASGSLNYAGPNKSMRMELELWGNPGDGPLGPGTPGQGRQRQTLRMDMSAGFGTPVALWREDARGIEGYFPGERTRYVHADPRAGAARMGLGVPLSLGDLAALVCGSYAGLVPAHYTAVRPSPDGGYVYEFSGPQPVSSLTLDAAGRPVVLAGRLQGVAWTLETGAFDEAATLPEPRRLALRTGDGATAIVRIKRLERRPAPWPGDRLALAVPEGTRTVPLELYETLDN